jgi:hypothetical protein
MNIPMACIFGLLLAGTAGADVVVMRDGSMRYGTLISRNAAEVRLRTNREGITLEVAIPVGQISRIVVGAEPPAARPVAAAGTASAPATTAPASVPMATGGAARGPAVAVAPPPAGAVTQSAAAGQSVPSASEAELAAFQTHGFLWELLASSLGKGPDDVNRLPAADRELWEQALQANSAGKQAETLDALRSLEAAMHDLPDGSGRLDEIARRERNESFGTWMARVHWDLINGKYSTGQFDLSDVRAIERRPLIGLLKKATADAMAPLRTFFPPVDEKTGVPAAFKMAQLQGITTGTALDLKDKSLLAAAVLLAQLKLEPEMPGADRALLYGELENVNRVLARARDLEPLAKAALVRAEQEKKAAEEKARREAAIAAQKKAAGK